MTVSSYFTNGVGFYSAFGLFQDDETEKVNTLIPLALMTLGVAALAYVYYRRDSKDFYQDLASRINKKDSYLYITDQFGCHKEKLLGIVGKGGSKKAVLLEYGRVLMVPNEDVEPLKSIVDRWNRIVNEEVSTSNLVNGIGLLAVASRRVTLSLSPDVKESTISAYVCESFENLGRTKNLFIIDNKNESSSTWKKSLFSKTQDRFDEAKWDLALEDLLVDISKMFLYNLPCNRDTLNIAVQENPNFISGKSAPYKARYFGFDFSSKSNTLEISKDLKMPERWALRFIISKFVDQLENLEFKNWSPEKKQRFTVRETMDEFFDRLIEKYTDRVANMCEEFIANSKQGGMAVEG